MKPLRIAYLLEDTAIAGGTRVAAAHADALIARGHEVVLVTKGPPLKWRRSRAAWQHVDALDRFDATRFDFVVGTFWTTLAAAHAVAGNRAIHFCQGYEGSFTAYQPMKAQIDAAYRLPLPKITVSPHLVAICRGFCDDATYIGQIVDDAFFQPHAAEENRPPRVLLVGPAEADFKGIDVAYGAVRIARESGAHFALVRVSQWQPAAGEPIELAREFHIGITTDEMARVIASCDLFLAPSRSEEGFGLPAAEAMASGIPGLLSRIPSFLSWDDRHDYGLFAGEGDPRGTAEALATLLADRELRTRIARRGREVVEQFRAERTGERLEKYFLSRRA